MKSAYLAAFLSCWLCVFELPETRERLIHLGNFEMSSLMSSGYNFSLAIPMLASIYHGLNWITNAVEPSYS